MIEINAVFFFAALVLLLFSVIIGLATIYKNRCHHIWKIVKEVGVVDTASPTLCNFTRYTLQCKKCGDIKIKNSDM